MKTRTLKQTCSSALIVIAALTVAFSFASAQAPKNEPSKAPGEPWLRELIVRLATRSGLLSQVCSPLIRAARCRNMVLVRVRSPALRSPGHGVWQHEHGWQNYSYAFTYYRYNSSGVFIGSQKVTSALELGASGDEFITHSVVSVLDVNDNVIATFCATAAGTRFE